MSQAHIERRCCDLSLCCGRSQWEAAAPDVLTRMS